MLQSGTIMTEIVPRASRVFSQNAVPGKKELFSHLRGFCKDPMPSTLMPARTAVQIPIVGEATAFDLDPGHQRCLAGKASANTGTTRAILYANEH